LNTVNDIFVTKFLNEEISYLTLIKSLLSETRKWLKRLKNKTNAVPEILSYDKIINVTMMIHAAIKGENGNS
ncbi:MAG: hypothetical protein LBR37_01175, partial [Erysipelotrichaceae bacterium]|nr:hypothetical protein [Erysipelotrichaceae bacterium]